jgi:RNA polymerase sigma factor (sigma-70 family)
VPLPPFEEVVEEHGAVVMRVCRTLLGRDDAQDAWSEAFLAALRTYPDLRTDSNVRGWLVTIAHRKSIDVLRRRKRRATPSADPPEVPTEDSHPATDEELRDALNALPERQRTAVVFRYLADLPYAEIAARLDTSEAAARRSAADGIAKLRATYGKEPNR